jgi:hypothetical protein
MGWQLAVVGLVVAAAVAYLARLTWRTWGRKASGCGGGCGSGCKGESRSDGGASAQLIPADQLGIRRRDGRAAP